MVDKDQIQAIQARKRAAAYRARKRAASVTEAQVKAARQAEIERFVWQMLAPYYDD